MKQCHKRRRRRLTYLNPGRPALIANSLGSRHPRAKARLGTLIGSARCDSQ
jgi:hypothetical protein